MRLIALLVVVMSLADADDERKKLEGEWAFVKSTTRMVFEGDKVMFKTEGKKDSVQGTYTVDAGKNPKTMDITLDKDGKKHTTLAIYELDGDTLRICHFLGQAAAKERPKEFAADKQTVLGVLKREKK